MGHDLDDLSSLTAFVAESIPILGAMGIRITVAEEGVVAAELPVDANRNHLGTAYAGSLASVAEVLGGVLAATTLDVSGCVPLIKSLAIDFRRPAVTDVTARAELASSEAERVRAEVLAEGRADFELTATITDVNAVVVATTLGVYQLRRL